MLNDDDDQETGVALMLAALGNEIRLRVYRMLVRAGRDGLNVGAIQARTGVPASTLAHHLGALKQAGLVRQSRAGREVICSADYAAMDRLVAYLTAECCAGAGLDDRVGTDREPEAQP